MTSVGLTVSVNMSVHSDYVYIKKILYDFINANPFSKWQVLTNLFCPLYLPLSLFQYKVSASVFATPHRFGKVPVKMLQHLIVGSTFRNAAFLINLAVCFWDCGRKTGLPHLGINLRTRCCDVKVLPIKPFYETFSCTTKCSVNM